MPFRSDGSWKVYVLRVADPTTIKEEELRKLSMAIEGHQNVAILGVASICDQSDQSTAKTSVFLHMADGEEKLSIMDPGKMPKARVRAWENILEHDWDALREIVGDELVVYLCKYLGNVFLLVTGANMVKQCQRFFRSRISGSPAVFRRSRRMFQHPDGPWRV